MFIQLKSITVFIEKVILCSKNIKSKKKVDVEIVL